MSVNNDFRSYLGITDSVKKSEISDSVTKILSFVSLSILRADPVMASPSAPALPASQFSGSQQLQNAAVPNNASGPVLSAVSNQVSGNPSSASLPQSPLSSPSVLGTNASYVARGSGSTSQSNSSSVSGDVIPKSVNAPSGSGFSARIPNASGSTASPVMHTLGANPSSPQTFSGSNAPARGATINITMGQESAASTTLGNGPVANSAVNIQIQSGPVTNASVSIQIQSGPVGLALPNGASTVLPLGNSVFQGTSSGVVPSNISVTSPSGFSAAQSVAGMNATASNSSQAASATAAVINSSAAQQSAFGASSSGILMSQQNSFGALVSQPKASVESFTSPSSFVSTTAANATSSVLGSSSASYAATAFGSTGAQQIASSVSIPSALGSAQAVAAGSPNASVSTSSAALHSANLSSGAGLSNTSTSAPAQPSATPSRQAASTPQVLPASSGPGPLSNDRPNSKAALPHREYDGILREEDEEDSGEGDDEDEEDNVFSFSHPSKKSSSNSKLKFTQRT